jgi:hypothetical protein
VLVVVVGLYKIAVGKGSIEVVPNIYNINEFIYIQGKP